MRCLHLIAAASVVVIVPTAEPGSRSFSDPESVGGEQQSCLGNQQSRWAAGRQGYVRTHTFGDGADTWLTAATGVAVSPGGDVVVYDGVEARIHVLDAQLRVLRTFGRRGSGPGELAVPLEARDAAYRVRNYVAADSLHIYVFDGRSIKVYSHSGALRNEQPRLPEGAGMMLAVRHLSSSSSGTFYSYDHMNLRNPTERRLETWEVRGAVSRRVHQMALPPAPSTGGGFGFHMPPQQARPVWALYGNCVVAGDGGSQHLVRVNLATRAEDTIRLPRHQVRLLADNSTARDGPLEAMRAQMAARGIRMPELSAEPTLLWRWAELIVDPDGHIWIQPWRERAERTAPTRVLRISPRGSVTEETLPGFPVAFGAPGVLYVREANSATDEPLISRYQVRP